MNQTVTDCLLALLQYARTRTADDNEAEDLVARTLIWAIDDADQFEPRFGSEN